MIKHFGKIVLILKQNVQQTSDADDEQRPKATIGTMPAKAQNDHYMYLLNFKIKLCFIKNTESYVLRKQSTYAMVKC